jgi:hypothetical protein
MDAFVGVLAALSPVLAAIIIGLFNRLQQQRERLVNAEAQVSEKRRAAYLAILEPMFAAMRAVIAGEPQPDQQALVIQLFDAQKELILFGSDEVMKAYQSWQKDARGGVMDFEKLGALLVAVRREWGHPETTVTPDDVLRPFITDYDQMRAAGQLRREIGQQEAD